VSKEWWKSLVNAIKGLSEEGDIGIYCYGGHGRTGTALSILASLSGNVPEKEDAVDWVRRNYCPEAVESWVQIDYIKQVTGKEVVSVPPQSIRRRPITIAPKGISELPWLSRSYQ